jgi:uncharacterized coiled-coil protein SlyX
MSQANPQDLDIQEIVRAEVSQIINHVGGVVGTEIGLLQKQLNNLMGLDAAAFTLLQTRVQSLYNLLDGDGNTPGMQNLQALMALLDRVAALETAQAVTDTAIANLNDAVADLDDRLSTLSGATAQELADMGAEVASATATAIAAQVTANAAQVAITVLSEREDDRHTNHGNAIGKLRTQVYLSHAGLAAVTIAGFTGAFNSAKTAALV